MRADVWLVRNGYFDSRARAQAAIRAGRVRVDGRVLGKPSDAIPAGARVEAQAEHPYVSRAALKLIAGLDHFGIDPAGRVCLDIGASTGGFTEVLLERGAARVYAVDAGRGQLHERLKGEARLVSLEATDARALTPELIPEPPSLIVCDASFIGLSKVLERPLGLAAPQCELVALIKPQFEAGPGQTGKGGVVRDQAVIEKAVADVRAWLHGRSGFTVLGVTASPITGGDGNREFLIAARKG
ncbi:MAG: TlyA family RNA methyltransferase [Maricaulaceae bacterium]|nr:TlyA family RNA methyltransferase [Maricaulaceae bacterium]